MRLNVSASSPLWRSLRHRNYRLYLTGQLVSVCGTWMQQVALSCWSIALPDRQPCWASSALHRKSQSWFWLNRRRDQRSLLHSPSRRVDAMRGPRSSAAAGIAGPDRLDTASPYNPVGNCAGSRLRVRYARASGVGASSVDTEDLANALALNSSMINAPRIVGPALAGLSSPGSAKASVLLSKRRVTCIPAPLLNPYPESSVLKKR